MNDVGQFTETRAQQAIDDCLAAYKACLQTAAYCANQGGTLADPHRLQVLHDCADVNLATANFLTRGSRFLPRITEVCAEISEACADNLSADEHDHPQLRVTYAACQRASRSCTEFFDNEVQSDEDAQREEALLESFPASDPPPPPTEL